MNPPELLILLCPRPNQLSDNNASDQWGQLASKYKDPSSVDFFFTKIKLKSIQVAQRPKYKRPFSIDYRERKSHARGVYPTQGTSPIWTARVKQEEEAEVAKEE